jgi:hypothetical protein
MVPDMTRRMALGLVLSTSIASALVLSAPAVAARPNSVAHQSANQIVKAAVAATRGASSFRVAGTVTSSGETVRLDLFLSPHSAKGTVSIKGQTIRLIRKGQTIYFSADKTFWMANGGKAVAQLLAGRWVYAPATNSNFSSFASFLDPHSLTSQMLSHPLVGTSFKKGRMTTVAGQRVIAISAKDSADNVSGVLYVATTGQPYIVKVALGGGSALLFTNYNKPVHVTTPENAINLSQLQTSGG